MALNLEQATAIADTLEQQLALILDEGLEDTGEDVDLLGEYHKVYDIVSVDLMTRALGGLQIPGLQQVKFGAPDDPGAWTLELPPQDDEIQANLERASAACRQLIDMLTVPESGEDARECIHNVMVWNGHECGDCIDRGYYAWRR